MTWRFQPIDDKCIDCRKDVLPTIERNYIVWDDKKKVYKRECAACHDKRLQVPFERRDVTDKVASKL